MPIKYVLTGGPGCGKTTLLLALEREGYHIVREAAEDVIKFNLANGIDKPWLNLAKFQDEILKLQIRREKRIKDKDAFVILDRGTLDGYAYYLLNNIKPSAALKRELGRKKKDKVYKAVFLIENLGSKYKKEFRREDLDESIKIEFHLEKIYKDYGYKVIRVKPDTVIKRKEFILKHIEKMNKSE